MRGRTWARGILEHHQLSLINLGMLAGLGRMDEFEMHFRIALTRTKVPLIQLREMMLHIGMYCGIPIARDAFVIARDAFVIARHVQREESTDQRCWMRRREHPSRVFQRRGEGLTTRRRSTGSSTNRVCRSPHCNPT